MALSTFNSEELNSISFKMIVSFLADLSLLLEVR